MRIEYATLRSNELPPHSHDINPTVPKGTVLAFAGDKPPPGWVFCNDGIYPYPIRDPGHSHTTVYPGHSHLQTYIKAINQDAVESINFLFYRRRGYRRQVDRNDWAVGGCGPLSLSPTARYVTTYTDYSAAHSTALSSPPSGPRGTRWKGRRRDPPRNEKTNSSRAGSSFPLKPYERSRRI